jgi:hypothetical protein
MNDSGWRAAGIVLAASLAGGLPVLATASTWAELAPLVAARCAICHSGAQAPAGLSLDSLESLERGSANGPVAKAGDPAGSELIRRLTGEKQPRMPMTGPPWLSDAEIEQFRRFVAAGLPAGAPLAAAAPSPPPAARAPGTPYDYNDVAPILARRCAKCHTEQGQMGPAPEGYRLTGHAETLSAVDRARVVPGIPEASELLRRVRGDAHPRMPFDGPPWLAAEEIAAIERWIADGARDGAGAPAPLPAGARLRLHGRWQAGDRLDALPVVVDGRTRIDKAPRPGDYVELRARLAADGRVLAERLRRR